MANRHKPKLTPGNELKASIIRRYGTIAAFAAHHEQKPATVYAALKFRRGGPVSRAIRAAAIS